MPVTESPSQTWLYLLAGGTGVGGSEDSVFRLWSLDLEFWGLTPSPKPLGSSMWGAGGGGSDEDSVSRMWSLDFASWG